MATGQKKQQQQPYLKQYTKINLKCFVIDLTVRAKAIKLLEQKK